MLRKRRLIAEPIMQQQQVPVPQPRSESLRFFHLVAAIAEQHQSTVAFYRFFRMTPQQVHECIQRVNGRVVHPIFPAPLKTVSDQPHQVRAFRIMFPLTDVPLIGDVNARNG
jgi:hypothetical protein